MVEKIKEYAINFRVQNPEIRHGQSLMVALKHHDFELYEEITATDADCFYVNEKIEKFFEKIEEKNGMRIVEESMSYRKKPVIVQAFQMTKERRLSNSDWPNWLHDAWQKDREEEGSLYPTSKGDGEGTISIKTLEGQQLVSFGDYIIQGVDGEIYPCKPEIFEKTYEKV